MAGLVSFEFPSGWSPGELPEQPSKRHTHTHTHMHNGILWLVSFRFPELILDSTNLYPLLTDFEVPSISPTKQGDHEYSVNFWGFSFCDFLGVEVWTFETGTASIAKPATALKPC